MRKNILLLLLVFAACHRDEIPEIVPSERTIIIYMAADNDLSADAYEDIEEMKEGFSEAGVNL
ncbi:MAG: peptidase C11, partial [Prevotellaceae bacterium]|nr:peptidase C11 [Prevotellaceae bacterium]